MRNLGKTQEIISFLSDAKGLLSVGKFDFVPRRKNMIALLQQNLTIIDAKNIIMGLGEGDYYKGPKRDINPAYPGDIWEFKTTVNRKPFYVKLKIVTVDGEETLKCLGFHEDDFANSGGYTDEKTM